MNYGKQSMQDTGNLNKGPESESFDILELLTACFNDIVNYGIVKLTNFAEGWMCPIYIKNDRNEISNYRPITILNSDYKLLTKVLATRLASIAPTTIHKSQAGWVVACNFVDNSSALPMRPVCIIPMFF